MAKKGSGLNTGRPLEASMRMLAPSSRSTRPPASRRQSRSVRSTVGSAPANVPAPACAASTDDSMQERSVERPAALGLSEVTCGDSVLARGLAPFGSGLDNRGATRKPTGAATRAQPRGAVTRSTPPPDRDRFLASVDALRGWLTCIGRDATWRVALTSVFGCISTQVPLPNETMLARALLFISAVTIGALVGRRLDRKGRRKP